MRIIDFKPKEKKENLLLQAIIGLIVGWAVLYEVLSIQL